MPAERDIESLLADVSDLSLEELLRIDNPIFQRSLKQVLEAEDNPQGGIVAGFQSAI